MNLKIINKLFRLSVIITMLHVLSFGQSKLINVVPEPQSYSNTNEKFVMDNEGLAVKCFNNDESILIALNDLKEIINRNSQTSINDGSRKKILIGTPDKSNYIRKKMEENNLLPDGDLGDEGYTLLIDSNEIIISANDPKGLFYGVQTLKQLFKGSISESSLHGIKIKDWPDYKYRAVSDDISRGPLPTLDYMKYQIRRFAEMKVNTLIHYVEHVVKTKSHPEFAPEDGSLTIEEWKEIADYADKYNIMVIGGFQSFGHFNNILKTPKYSHLGERGTLISPVLDESYKFLEDIYSEMIPAFNSPFFNINCDETFDLGKDQSKALVDSIGYDGVYFQHIMKLYNIVKKYNKRVIMWGDILLEYPNLLEKLPKDILIGTWTYDPLDDFSDYIIPIKDVGFEFWVVPGVLNSYRLFPNYYQAITNIKNFTADGFKYGASGVLNCVWDDGGSTLFTNAWYGVAYGADKSWNSKSSDGKKFDSRFNKGLYGSSDDLYTETLHKITGLAYLEPTDGMTDKILFAKVLPDEGKNLKISVKDWDKVNNIVDEAEEMLRKSSLQYYHVDKEYLLYAINLYRTLADERLDLLKAAQYYSQAESIYTADQFKARELVLFSLDLIMNIIEREYKLKDTFSELWLKENHTYALDWTTDKYDEKINEFINVKNRLISSLASIDSSHPIMPKEKVRLAISKLPGKYFREWMMVNPIAKNEKGNISKIDYLKDMGGEENAVPRVTQEFYYDSEKYRWRRVVSEYPDIVNLAEIFPDENTDVVMYAFANLSVENDTTVNALVGFDDAIEVFINGKSIVQKYSNGNFVPDSFSFSLPLLKGKNNLLLKITQTKGKWGFSFRLPDCEVRNSKNRYRIVNDSIK